MERRDGRMRAYERAVALGLALLVLGCTSNRKQTTERTEFENASARRLAVAREGLDSLTEELRLRGDSASLQLRQRIDSLTVAKDVAARKLDSLRTAESGRWREIKGEVTELTSNLEAQIDSLRARVRR
jgi:hypothetical protein